MKNESRRLRVFRFWRKGERSGRVSISNDRATFAAVEVAFLTRLYGFGVETDEEQGLGANLMLGLAACWIHFPCLRVRSEREWSVRFFDGGIWVSLGALRNEWNSKDPWWLKSHTWRPLDTIFGAMKHSVRAIIDERDVEIPMPEASYPAHVRIEDEQWKRARWPIARVVRRAHVDIPKGVPHAGKWGEDGLFGMTTPLRNKRSPVEEAISACVASVLAERWRFSHNHRDTGKRLEA